MSGSHKVKIEGELLEKVRTCVKAGGYESVDAFVVRVLEKEVEKILPRDNEGGYLKGTGEEAPARAGIH